MAWRRDLQTGLKRVAHLIPAAWHPEQHSQDPTLPRVEQHQAHSLADTAGDLLNLPLVRLFVRILSVPTWFLMPAVVAISFVAVYAVNNSPFDILLMSGFGVLGYLMRKTGFPVAPLILGLVLGPLM